MSSEEPNLIADIVHRGREASFIYLFGLDRLCIDHLGLQVGIELVQLVSPFLYSRRGREIGRFGRPGRFVPDDIS